MGPDRAAIRKVLAEHLGRRPEAAAVNAVFAGRRLKLALPPEPRKGLRAQDIVAEAFGIGNPVPLLRRDAVVLRTGPESN